MDVVNGKIVSARAKGRFSDEGRSALQPSVEGVHPANGAASWATPTSSFHSLGLEPSAGRWNKLPGSVEKLRHIGGFRGMPHRPAPEHSLGWRHFRFGSMPETNLDQMLTRFESQLTGAATMPAGHASSSSGLENPTLRELSTLQRSKSDIPAAAAVGMTSPGLKRKRCEADVPDEAERAWQRPLKLLLRKALSMSDVGELGRVVIPKKSAETEFQRYLDIKGGTTLEMHDYDGTKRWFFRFKWWINNKSRMYVLENTREFIKYHGLKEHDIFIVYEDNSKKTVVRGHKGTDMDSLFDDLQDKITNGTEAEGPACTTEDSC